MPPEQVHFHEVGAVDSIVDIVGACIAVEMLGKPRILASTVIEGTSVGSIARTDVSRFPRRPRSQFSVRAEFHSRNATNLTNWSRPPALRCSLNSSKPLARCKISSRQKSVSASARATTKRAQMFCAQFWEKARARLNDWETDTISVLETNLDDINAEILGHVSEKALAAGALDVFHTPIQMKKNRPGVLLTILCAVADADKFSEMILRETSAFGVRRSTLERRKLQREFQTVNTQLRRSDFENRETERKNGSIVARIRIVQKTC